MTLEHIFTDNIIFILHFNNYINLCAVLRIEHTRFIRDSAHTVLYLLEVPTNDSYTLEVMPVNNF